MSWTSPDRWSCPYPGCHSLVVIDGSELDTAAAIQAVQERHGKAHRKAAVLAAKLKKTA